MKSIRSRDNAHFKFLRGLATSSRARKLAGQTLIDGPHLLADYLAHIGPPRELVVAEDVLRDDTLRTLIERAACTGTVLPPSLFRELSPVETPTGLLALIDIPNQASAPSHTDCLVLEGIQDSGNLGTLLRTAAAVGVREVILAPGCAQVWSPKVLRAGQGAHFLLQLRETTDPAAVLRDFPGRILATRLDAAVDLYDLELSGGPVAWLFGNEGRGLSAAVSELASQGVKIAMPGGMESLNVAMAATVCLFEQLRQRRIAEKAAR